VSGVIGVDGYLTGQANLFIELASRSTGENDSELLYLRRRYRNNGPGLVLPFVIVMPGRFFVLGFLFSRLGVVMVLVARFCGLSPDSVDRP